MIRHSLSSLLMLCCLLTACKQSPPSFECSDAIGCVDIAPGEPIELGAIQDLSGGAATFGITQVRSIELALAQRDNQLLGHPIELQSEDEECLPEGGINAALKITMRPQAVAIIGTTCSGAAVTASKLVSEAGLVMVSGANIAPSLTAIDTKQGADWQPGYLRTIYNGATLGRVAAIFAYRELGLTQAATLDDGDAYTQELADVFEQAFTELGGEIVASTTVNKGDADMHPVLTAIAIPGAELVFFPVFPAEGALIVQQAQEVAGLENIILIGADGLRVDSFVEAVGADGIGMYFVGSTLPQGPANDTLAFEYESRYGKAPAHLIHIFAYDATNLVLDAIESVAVQEKDGTLHIGRQALRDALYATADFEGVTGRLTCDRFGDCGAARFEVVRLDDPTAGVAGLLSNVVYTYTQE